jgi:hypothetical protein
MLALTISKSLTGLGFSGRITIEHCSIFKEEEVEKKFKILRIVAFVWKIVAWVILVISVLGGCGSLVMSLMAGNQLSRQTSALGLGMLGGAVGGIIIAVVAILVGLFYFISLYAVAEMIDVALALEENTRATAEQLKNIAKS